MAVPGAVALARLISVVGGDRVLVAGLVAGVAAGGLVGVVATQPDGAGKPAGGGIVACPDDRVALLHVGSGQKMLITGRSADGAWYRVYLGSPGRSAGWVRADEVTLQAPGDTLPVVECNPDAGTANAVGPAESLTAIVGPTNPPEGSPSPSATEVPSVGPTATAVAATVGPTSTPTHKPRVTPTPTPRVRATHTPTPRPTRTPKPPPPPTTPPPPPDTTGPTISDMFQYEDRAYFCNGGAPTPPTEIPFIAFGVRDTGGTGVDRVELHVRQQGGQSFGPYPMKQRATPTQWGYSLKGSQIGQEGIYDWWVVAYDRAGNATQRTTSSEGPAEFIIAPSCEIT